jgi:hypothetical protein
MQNEQPKKLQAEKFAHVIINILTPLLIILLRIQNQHQILLYVIPIMKTCQKRFLAHGKL